MPTTIDVKDAAGTTQTVNTIDALLARVGEVQTSPTANTVLDRLKALATLLGGTLVVGDGGGSITVDGTVTVSNAGFAVVGNVEVTNDVGNPLPVSASSLPLPTGAATAANQTTGNTSLASIDTKTPALAGGRVPVDGSGVTQPVSGPLTDAQLRAAAVPVAAGGYAAAPSAAFNRPADTTAYASGDLVANSTTAGSVTPMQFTAARTAAGTFSVRRARLRKSGTSLTNASFRLHLYAASPTPANGDNGAWSTDRSADYLGALDVTCDRAFTDGAAGNGVPLAGGEITHALASGQVVFGLLEARAAYTPTSGETFAVVLEVLQN